MGQVTARIVDYPPGYEPDYVLPKKYCSYRFALGRRGKNPLVVIGMNPSAAEENHSDFTVNRVIGISKKLGSDGWMIFNLYPERATDAGTLSEYDRKLSSENVDTICRYLSEHNVKEVWGAWGDDRGLNQLKFAKQELLNALSVLGIKVFYFGTLTKSGNPRHPLQRFEKWDYNRKNYLF